MRKTWAAAAALTLALAGEVGAGEGASAPVQAPAEAQIARLLVAAPAREHPRSSSRLIRTVAAVRPLTGQQTALPVVETAEDAAGATWLRVLLPFRPNGGTGWIRRSFVRVTEVRWRVVINRAVRLASLFRSGRLVERVPVVVGKASTPTPRGRFFVVEHVRQDDRSDLGGWALATSAHSNVLQEFDGGPGQIALHGRRGPLAVAPLGTAASHGCIRFDNSVIARLARLLPNGTPVEIL